MLLENLQFVDQEFRETVKAYVKVFTKSIIKRYVVSKKHYRNEKSKALCALSIRRRNRLTICHGTKEACANL